jgi:hypothetical protein
MSDETTPNEELIAYCPNLKCLRAFHLQPANQDDVDLFNAILGNPHARGPVWMTLRCPVCGHTFQALGPALEHCSCGKPVHSESESTLPAE